MERSWLDWEWAWEDGDIKGGEVNMSISAGTSGACQSRQQIWDYYRYPLQQVEERVRRVLEWQGDLIARIGNYSFCGGGKRLRPLLAIVASRLEDEKNFDEDVIIIASAVELIHTASLLHDDVLDEAVIRRDKDSARVLWGNKASILVGDHLIAQGFSAAQSIRDETINDTFVMACHLMTQGETLQIANRLNLELTEKDYLRIIEYKTAALISATCELSAIVAKMSPKKQKALARFGLYLGMAHQMIDDALDYCGKSHLLGKTVCKDFREGEVTLPLLHLLSRCGKNEKNKVDKLLGKAGLSEKDLNQVLNLIKGYKSIEYSVAKAHEAVRAAKGSLCCYPDSIHRQALMHLADYVISRDH